MGHEAGGKIMDFEDRKDFANQMVEMAAIVQRPVDDEDIAAYFNHLKEYPLGLVCDAMDKAFRDRDPQDMYMKTLLITVPEIQTAIDEMLAVEHKALKIGCKECNDTGLILKNRKDKSIYAIKCKCLLAAIAARKKGKKNG